MVETTNQFLIHTDLPVNSGGDPEQRVAIRYQHQTQFDDADWMPRDELGRASDRVYKNPVTGRFFKVRARRRPALESRVDLGGGVIIVSVAQCDSDGYALAHDRLGWAICPEHSFNPPGDSPVDVAASLEQTRLIQCAAAELRIHNEAALAGIPTE